MSRILGFLLFINIISILICMMFLGAFRNVGDFFKTFILLDILFLGAAVLTMLIIFAYDLIEGN